MKQTHDNLPFQLSICEPYIDRTCKKNIYRFQIRLVQGIRNINFDITKEQNKALDPGNFLVQNLGADKNITFQLTVNSNSLYKTSYDGFIVSIRILDHKYQNSAMYASFEEYQQIKYAVSQFNKIQQDNWHATTMKANFNPFIDIVVSNSIIVIDGRKYRLVPEEE